MLIICSGDRLQDQCDPPLILAQNKGAPHLGDSNEYIQSMFGEKQKETITILHMKVTSIQ